MQNYSTPLPPDTRALMQERKAAFFGAALVAALRSRLMTPVELRYFSQIINWEHGIESLDLALDTLYTVFNEYEKMYNRLQFYTTVQAEIHRKAVDDTRSLNEQFGYQGYDE